MATAPLSDGFGAAERPAALIEYERKCEARQTALREQYPNGAPPDVMHRLAEEQGRKWDEMYAALTVEERAAETARVNAALAADAKAAFLAANSWHAGVANWKAQESIRLGDIEGKAAALAERALTRCTYLGGLPDYPRRTETYHVFCCLPIELCWRDRSGNAVAVIRWSDVRGIRVSATDRSQEHLTASRVALIGVLALGAKKKRREAMLAVQTPTGEAIFIVHGHTPLELQAQLAPLVARVGEPTSSQSVMDTGIDQLLLERGKELLFARSGPASGDEQ